MRLLNTKTLTLHPFITTESQIPPYAILSHTWQSSELLFDHLTTQSPAQLTEHPQYRKLKHSCLQAARDGLSYIWIDTCCIDKGSSAELSEAINSMFRWYQQATVCYVYLADFTADHVAAEPHELVKLDPEDRTFCSSSWFGRGWTLQELIAPRNVRFFDSRWVEFGTRDEDLFTRICERTKILPPIFSSRRCLCPGQIATSLRNSRCTACNARDNLPDILGSLHASIIMSWAATRVTTRKEDAAYSLLGLFDVNMPLLYGEGDKAFARLQSAILAQANDDSILLWRTRPNPNGGFLRPGCLATSPSAFEFCAPIVPQRTYYDFENAMKPWLTATGAQDAEPMAISDTLLHVSMWLCPCRMGYPFNAEGDASQEGESWSMGILSCSSASDYLARPAILLLHMGANVYRRIACDSVFLVNPRKARHSSPASTLSLYNGDPNATNPHSNWNQVLDMDIGRATWKQIKILVRPSGPSLLPSPTGTFGRISASTDAVCCVVNQPPWTDYTIMTKIIGGYPTIYSGDTHQVTVPLLRSLINYECTRGLGLVGGIHLIELSIPDTKLCERIYVLWGLHHGDITQPRERTQIQAEGQPWCRVFRSSCFDHNSEMPVLEPNEMGDRRADLRYKQQLHALLVKKSQGPAWQVTGGDGSRRRVLPDIERGDKPVADRLLDVFVKTSLRVGVSARMNVIKRLGVSSNDVELTFLTPECRGWQTESFDGSPNDQEAVRRH